MEPGIQYAKTSDGVNIAYWTMGEGPPVVYINSPPWSNIEFEAREWPMHGIISSRCTLIRYDHRGTGSSQRDVDKLSLDARVLDVEAVVDRLGLNQFVLLAFDGPIAITYAARHPEHVFHLLMYGAVPRMADEYDLPRMRNAYAILNSGDWEMFTDTLGLAWAGWADSGLARDLSTFFRTCTDSAMARRTIEAYAQADVTDLLPSLQVPVSIVYPKESPMTDINTARSLAAAIPNARLTIADSTTGWSPETQEAFFAVLDEALAEMTGNPILVRREAAPGGLVSILFTDMEGSTTLADRLGDAAAQDVRLAHNDIVRSALAAHSGNEIKHTGDGIMASFATASSALDAAIAIQRGVAAHRQERPDSPLGVYVGLNAGEPIAEDDDLFGTSINLAARICDHAEHGQIVASNVVRELAAGKDFLFSDLGETELRGFEDPVRLYEVRWREGDNEPAETPTTPSRPALVLTRLTNNSGHEVEVTNRGKEDVWDIAVESHEPRPGGVDQYRKGTLPFLQAGATDSVFLPDEQHEYRISGSGYGARISWTTEKDRNLASACFHAQERKAGARFRRVEE